MVLYRKVLYFDLRRKKHCRILNSPHSIKLWAQFDCNLFLVLEKMKSTYFRYFVIISQWEMNGSSFEHTWLPFIQRYFMPSLLDIWRVVLENSSPLGWAKCVLNEWTVTELWGRWFRHFLYLRRNIRGTITLSRWRKALK